jgi:hypothetical protein
MGTGTLTNQPPKLQTPNAPLPALQVEQYYQDQGFLLPGHQNYWMGTRLPGHVNGSNDTWWQHDPLAPRLGPGVYDNWGTNQPSGITVGPACRACL